MKKISKRAFLLAMIGLLACETSEETFLDYYKIYTSLPPASSEIASPYKSQEFHAYINERGEIYGTGNGNRFYTDDLFETIHMERGFGKFGDYIKDGKNVLTLDKVDNDVVIAESFNYGFDFTPKLTIPIPYYHDIATFFLDGNTGWIIDSFGKNIHVYQIKDGQYTQLSTTGTDMYPGLKSVYFKNELEGCMLITDTDGELNKFYTTQDGGLSWKGPSAFDLQKDAGNTPYMISTIKAYGNLIVGYPDEEGRTAYYRHLYLSRDGGTTWEFINNDKACYQFVNEYTGYALEIIRYVRSSEDDVRASTSYLSKTIDGGRTWRRVSDQVLYADNIYFATPEIGIATSYSFMQVTFDGGRTWHPLIFPLDEPS